MPELGASEVEQIGASATCVLLAAHKKHDGDGHEPEHNGNRTTAMQIVAGSLG